MLLFENEISRELIGPSNINPFVMHESASRIAMSNKQTGQAVVVKNPDLPIWLTGVEREYGKYTHGTNMPANARIVRVIEKYQQQMSDTIERPNPKLVVVFEDMDKVHSGERTFDCIEIEMYHYLHQTWGHRNQPKEGFHKLVPDEYIPKGTPIVGSPNVDEAGNYKLGVEANVALFSTPEGIEDGIGIRRGYLDKLATRAYGRRIATYSGGQFPLNLYGGKNSYRGFPDIGDKVRKDGLLFATRVYDEALGPIQLTDRNTRRANKLFDSPVYAPPGATIVDVNVYRSPRAKMEMPTGTFDQLKHYHSRLTTYNQSLIQVHDMIKREYGSSVRIAPRLSNLVESAMFYVYQGGREAIDFSVKKVPVGEWYVEVIYEYETVPIRGSKMSGLSGDKGVVTHIFEDEDAPRDANGDIVDITMDADSTVKRMNLGRLIRQYGSSSARATQLKMEKMVQDGSDKSYLAAYALALDWYSVASPEMHDSMLAFMKTDEQKIEHAKSVVKKGFYVYRPVESREPATEMVAKMLEKHPALFAPITYRTIAGKMETTVDNILVGRMYILLLDKMATSYSAIASPRFQHHGIPAKVSAMDKYAVPGRYNPLRVFGETEYRILTSVGAGPAAVEAHDQSNNPRTQREAVQVIQQADNPMQIPELVDRKKFPLGFSRPHQFVFHNLKASGINIFIGEEQE